MEKGKRSWFHCNTVQRFRWCAWRWYSHWSNYRARWRSWRWKNTNLVIFLSNSYDSVNNLNNFHIKSLQLCVNVQIPKSLRGLGGAAVFIDTNRGLSVDRMKGQNFDQSIVLNFVKMYLLIILPNRDCDSYKNPLRQNCAKSPWIHVRCNSQQYPLYILQ